MNNKIICAILAVSFCQTAVARKEKIDYERDFNSLLTLSGKAGYSLGNLFGSGTVPTFSGAMYGGEVEYIFGRAYFSVAPFFEYRWMRIQNSANTLTSTDSWQQSYWGGGLRVYTGRAFFKAGYGSSSVTESISISGNTARYTASPKTLLLGAGMSWVFPRYLRVEMGADMMHTKVRLIDGNFPARRDLFHYSAYLALKLVLDSGYRSTGKKK